MIKITTDSTCDLPKYIVEQHDITVMPLGVIKAGKLYQDGINIRTADIAAHVDAGGEITTTNAVNVADYETVFRELTAKYDAVIHINIGMGFSCCYQNAKLAAEDIPEVYVVDSANLTVGHGLLVMAAAEAAEAGKSVPEILAMLEDMIPRIGPGRQPSEAAPLPGRHRRQAAGDQEVPGLHRKGGGGLCP